MRAMSLLRLRQKTVEAPAHAGEAMNQHTEAASRGSTQTAAGLLVQRSECQLPTGLRNANAVEAYPRHATRLARTQHLSLHGLAVLLGISSASAVDVEPSTSSKKTTDGNVSTVSLGKSKPTAQRRSPSLRGQFFAVGTNV